MSRGTPVRLSSLDPSWVGTGGEGISDKDGNPVPHRSGIGISFECPCGAEDCPRAFIPFENPLSGGPPSHEKAWTRTGDTFDTLTLMPSIQRVGGCGWHGWIRNGEVVA